MANTFYFRNSAGERLALRLHSLAEYEADGGIYSDAGNGGETVSPESFICAATVPQDLDDSNGYTDDHDVLEAAGVEGAWNDSVTGYWLLTDWPAEAPLEARMLELPA